MAEMTVLARLSGPALPGAFAGLLAAADGEGVRIPARVAAEWADGFRFDRAGEALLAAWRGAALAGIGGVTLDPDWPDALRMRRFYVRPACRRAGVARRIALAVLAGVAPGRTVTVHAGTPDAPPFWEALGFEWDPALRLHRLRHGTVSP